MNIYTIEVLQAYVCSYQRTSKRVIEKRTINQRNIPKISLSVDICPKHFWFWIQKPTDDYSSHIINYHQYQKNKNYIGKRSFFFYLGRLRHFDLFYKEKWMRLKLKITLISDENDKSKICLWIHKSDIYNSRWEVNTAALSINTD